MSQKIIARSPDGRFTVDLVELDGRERLYLRDYGWFVTAVTNPSDLEAFVPLASLRSTSTVKGE